MSKKLHLALYWHMHQPYYRDDIDGRMEMPWVFLHAIKDYYDILWYQSLHKSIKASFNLVPSLIEQIQSYIEGTANDALLECIKKDVSFLHKEDKELLSSYLFLANEKNMIKPLPRYYELYKKFTAAEKHIDAFSAQDLLDTQVLFLLSWCGVYLRENNATVKKLLKKSREYTHQEKSQLIDTLCKFLEEILSFYKQCESEGLISVSTTPHYHPILPLLLDFGAAKEARSDVVMPHTSVSFESFGIRNIKDANEMYKEVFGKYPDGFWPAEGSVSYKALGLMCVNNIKWCATDEEILFRTLGRFDKKELYKNYNVITDYGQINIRFRDHRLSDLIGFEYSKWDAKKAAEDFVHQLRGIYDSCEFSPLVNVILDGENAWEYYSNNAYEFFDTLYTLLAKEEGWCTTEKMDDIASIPDIVTTNLNTLATGSWISGNFDIWIGSKQKNRAWELLDITKKDYDLKKDKLESEKLKLIEKEFMIALGSDWFWWYGDDHYTVQKEEFDELFRKHLINIYNLMDMVVPVDIMTPIVQSVTSTFHSKPKQYISPKIDGKRSSYFEWLDAGRVDVKKEFSAMDTKPSFITHFNYGFDREHLYLSFEGNISELIYDTAKMVVYFNELTFVFDVKFGHQQFEKDTYLLDIFVDQVLEMKVTSIVAQSDKSIDFKFEIIESQKAGQVFPIYSDFIIELERLKRKNWYI